MVLDRCESSEHAATCCHECPLCGQVRMTSDPVTIKSRTGRGWARNDEDGSHVFEPFMRSHSSMAEHESDYASAFQFS